MSYFFLNDANDSVQAQLSALKASNEFLNTRTFATISSGIGDILNQNKPAPRNPQEAIQFFYNEFFGQSDPYYYTSKYGNPIYNYLLIKGDEPDGNFSTLSTLSSYRTKYTNSTSNSVGRDAGSSALSSASSGIKKPKQVGNPNTWDEVSLGVTTTRLNSFPAVFMDSAIIKVSKKKKIIKTNIVNNPYTRKEYISSGDYDIQISGVFTTDNAAVYPEADVNALIRACESPIPLTIISPYLYRFGITRMVVEGFDFPNERGSYASQKFSIRACSHAATYAEIGAELANDTQNKSFIKETIDEIGNLRSTIAEELENIDFGSIFNSRPQSF